MVMQIANTGYAFACRMDNVKEASAGNMVISGCEVTANSPADMNVDIAAGVIRIAGVSVTVSAVNNQAIDASDADNDRYDILCVGANGTVDYIAGTPAANPMPPDLTADHILLATIFVEEDSTTVETADIADQRIIDLEGRKLKFVGKDTEGTNSSASTTETTLCNLTIPANTVTTCLIIMAPIGISESAVAGKVAYFRIKTGSVGAETQKAISNLVAGTAAGATFFYGGTICWVESTLDFSAEQSVLITSQHYDTAATTTTKCQQLIVWGF